MWGGGDVKIIKRGEDIMKNEKENLILNLSLEFALAIIAYSERLEDLKKYVIARQLLKSGTSIGANIKEA